MLIEKSLVSSYGRLAVLILCLNVLSALIFIATVRRPVYDDSTNSLDVRHYLQEGVTLQSIRSHLNPTGPGSFIWMAAGAWLWGGEELRGARIAILSSWILLGIGILISARHTGSAELWYAALLTTLIFPHTMTATATLMTEGPALLAAILGTFAWTVAITQQRLTVQGVILLLLGGFALGLAVICRQYYLALLPAAAIVAAVQIANHAQESRPAWSVAVLGSLVLAVVPCIVLIIVWKGLSSPSMVAGASYKQWRAAVGINLIRPGICIFYVAVYLLLLTFPTALLSRFPKRWLIVACALVAASGTALFRESIVQPGPLHSMEKAAGVFRHGEFLAIALVAALAFYNAVAFAMLVWEKRSALLGNSLVLFALFTIAFFVFEQIGVGGNIPFYDRYVLQLAPFLGIVVFHALPGLKAPRLVTVGLLILLSHEMLWRNAFGH